MPHELINPPELAPARGFSHVTVCEPGRTVHVAGQTAHDADGNIASSAMADQFAVAVRNLHTALQAADAYPEHIVSLQIYVTDVTDYRDHLGPIGAAWRDVLGDWYPAVSLFEVEGLFDPAARIELVATAVIPGEPSA